MKIKLSQEALRGYIGTMAECGQQECEADIVEQEDGEYAVIAMSIKDGKVVPSSELSEEDHVNRGGLPDPDGKESESDNDDSGAGDTGSEVDLTNAQVLMKLSAVEIQKIAVEKCGLELEADGKAKIKAVLVNEIIAKATAE